MAYKVLDSRAYHRGELAERKVWEAKQKDAQIDSLKAYTEELKTAASVGQSIANALYAAAMAKAQIQFRTQTIVKEVERENAVLPNADTCLMPEGSFCNDAINASLSNDVPIFISAPTPSNGVSISN